MARPRSVSDDDLLDAATALMHHTAPADLTFAALAKATGLSPATLVQRFGTKDAMIEAALLRAWDQLDARTASADARCALTPQGAIDLLVGLSDYGDHERYAEGLLLLREDIRNPVLRARGEAWGRALTTALGRRLTADAERQRQLGRLMASQWQGALLWWGFSRDGEIAAFVADELAAFLAIVVDRA